MSRRAAPAARHFSGRWTVTQTRAVSMPKAYAVVSYRSSLIQKGTVTYGDLVATAVLEEPSPEPGAVPVTEIFRCPMSDVPIWPAGSLPLRPES